MTHEMEAVRPNIWGSFEALLLATAKSRPCSSTWIMRATVAPGTDLASLRRERGGAGGRQCREMERFQEEWPCAARPE